MKMLLPIITWLIFTLGLDTAVAHVPGASKAEFRRTPLEPPRESLSFTLTDQFGKRLSLEDFRGKVVVLTFLYTHCPDVCPLVAMKLRETRNLIGAKASDVVFLAVTVDPERDTVERLNEYSKKIDMLDQWHFLTGNKQELRPIWDYYWVGKVWKDHKGGVMHQAPVHMIDPRGKIRVVSGATFDAEDLAHDIEALLRPYGDPFLSDWDLRPDVFFVVGFVEMIFMAGWLRLRRRNPRAVRMWQLALYLGGLGAILLALVSPIEALAEERLSMHMVQHLLLLMIAPLSLLLANPLPPLLWGFPGKVRLWLGRLLARSSVFRTVFWALTLLPVTWSVYVVNLWAWHHPVLYQLALRNEWVHDLQHLLFFFTAVLFWWPIINPAPRLHGTISYGYRIIYLVAATVQNTLLGMAISIPERVLYPFYATVPRLRALAPIDDQALGGGIMWVSGHMYLIPILVLVARLLKREEAAVNRSVAKEVLNRSHG
jgi:cytochrome c oxidase assembly factor CtaG/cytochrome oxidase Cu insertion factor (SCO1/SenC/PrrC family)